LDTYQVQLDAVGDSTRRAILSRLAGGPAPVGELARDLPVSRPAISQHLKILKKAQLVSDRADGTRRIYQLDPVGFLSLRHYFDQFWTAALEAYKNKVEEL